MFWTPDPEVLSLIPTKDISNQGNESSVACILFYLYNNFPKLAQND